MVQIIIFNLSSFSSLFKKTVKSKDDLDFIELNKQIATSLKIKRAPSVELLQNVLQKRNKSLETYENNVKGKIPE